MEKTKDSINAHFDLESLGISPEHQLTPLGDGRNVFHPACYTLSKENKISILFVIN